MKRASNAVGLPPSQNRKLCGERGRDWSRLQYEWRLQRGVGRGSVGDPYDNALAETIITQYKTELIRQRGPCRTIDDVPPAEYEMAYYRQQVESAMAA